jgi:hypothetical protein
MFDALPPSDVTSKSAAFQLACLVHDIGTRWSGMSSFSYPDTAFSLFTAGFLCGLVFDPEDAGDTFPQNVDGPLLNYILL